MSSGPSPCTRAGAYEGKIDLLPGEGGDAKMIANVRDYWPWALLVIAAGVLLGAAVARYFTIKRSQARLLLELEQLRDEIQTADDDFRKRAPESYTSYSIALRLGERLAKAQERLMRGEPDETKKVTDELDAVRTYLETARRMWRQVELLAGSAVKVASLAKTKGFGVVGDEVPAVQEALRLVEDPFADDLPDEKATALEERKTAVEGAVALLEQLRVSLPIAAALRNAAKNVDTSGWTDPDLQADIKALQTHREALGKALNELISATSVDDAKKSLSALTAAVGAIRDLVRRRQGVDANPELFAESDVTPPAAFASPDPLPEPLVATDEIPPPRATIDAERARLLRENFKRTDRRMTLATGMLALFSGLLALYSTAPTWGSPSDYLKAFLWGSVVSEGVKQVAALVARTGTAP